VEAFVADAVEGGGFCYHGVGWVGGVYKFIVHISVCVSVCVLIHERKIYIQPHTSYPLGDNHETKKKRPKKKNKKRPISNHKP